MLHAIAGEPAPPEHDYLGTLTRALRPEFDVDVYVPARDDAALYGPPCDLDGCERPSLCRTRGMAMCNRHRRQWAKACRAGGEISHWATTSPEDGGPVLDFEARPCRLCPRAAAKHGMCTRCWARRTRKPEMTVEEFCAWRPTVASRDRPKLVPTCRVPDCQFESSYLVVLC